MRSVSAAQLLVYKREVHFSYFAHLSIQHVSLHLTHKMLRGGYFPNLEKKFEDLCKEVFA